MLLKEKCGCIELLATAYNWKGRGAWPDCPFPHRICHQFSFLFLNIGMLQHPKVHLVQYEILRPVRGFRIQKAVYQMR